MNRTLLRTDTVDRLCKPAVVPMTAECNVVTRAYMDARLIGFVEHETRIDEKEPERLFERGVKAWRDVPGVGNG